MLSRQHLLSLCVGVFALTGAPMEAGSSVFMEAGSLDPAQAAQAPTRGKLQVTVSDPSGAVIPGAKVLVVNQDEAPGVAPVEPVLTTPQGVASLENLSPGRYTIQAEFPGFETVQVRDFRLRAGDNRRSVTLPIRRVAEEVVVGRDGRAASLDPQGAAFSTILTREQIAALPDDPDQMAQVLQTMAPPGATIRVDGFTGGRLPPKSQIRSIRLPRMDQYAAQNHGGMGGMMFIDIMTQPGSGPIRGSLDFAFRDEAMNARNPFTPEKGLEQLRQGGGSISGSIVPNKSSFFVNAQRASQFDSTNLLAALPGSNTAAAIGQPTDRSNLMARFDQATTKDRTLRLSFLRSASDRRNLGVGAYDLTGRAYRTSSAENILRVSENGPIGRQVFLESRLQVRWTNTEDTSSLEAPTVRVLDSFTSGGAQRSGGRHVLDFEAASDLDFVRGAHSMRAGMLLEGGRYRADDFSNYLGTYTFASLADFDAGRPSSYTRRIGDPNIRYSNVQVGLYAQDDYRIARSLLLSYGVRYEAQTLIPDQINFQPRASLAWSPLKSGKTTVRANAGYFTDWLGAGIYEQTQRFDGFRQQELNILNPSYPDPGTSGLTPPTNRYLLSDGLVLPESASVNVGLDQAITPNFRLSTTYTYRRGFKSLRGRDLNARVNGIRPDPLFSNVLEVVGDAAARTHSFGLNASMVKLNWHSLFLHGNYSLTSSETNSTGAFSPPSSGADLSVEWAQTTPRHRVGGMISLSPIRNLNISVNGRAQSGMPYNITTGFDTNGDGLFTDRPAGTARNSARTTAQWDLGARVSYAIGFGNPRGAGGGSGGGQAIVLGGGGGMPAGGFGGGSADKRYRVEFYASAQNLTNHRNYVGYSGVMTSQFFGQPTGVMNPRKIEIGARFGF